MVLGISYVMSFKTIGKDSIFIISSYLSLNDVITLSVVNKYLYSKVIQYLGLNYYQIIPFLCFGMI
jgi:hypothetical protein